MTICNMSIEGGARAGLIAPDDTTFEYVEGRPHAPHGADWDAARRAAGGRSRPTTARPTTGRSRSTRAPSSRWSPTARTPAWASRSRRRVPSPDDQADPAARRALERALEYMDLTPGQPILGQKVDVVFVGSCTNGRISDLRLAASVLKDRQVADGVRVMIVPGSDEVKREAEREGLHEIFRAAGAEWREAGCSMCIAMNGDQLSARPVRDLDLEPQLRGPPGQGRPDVPRLAADRRRVGDRRRRRRPAPPARHRVDRRRRRPLRWPQPFATFTSRVIPLPAENVDTDQIVPARYLKVTDKDGLADALFRDWRFDEDGSLREPRFVLDRAGDGRPEDPARRRQLRGRLVARARAVGAHRVGHPGDPVDLVRRHLPEQLPQERRSCRSSSRPEKHRQLFELVAPTRTPS